MFYIFRCDILPIAIASIALLGCAPAKEVRTIKWDLSQGSELTKVGWPEEEHSDDYIVEQDIDFDLKLPDGIQFNERGDLLICHRDYDRPDRLRSVSFKLHKGSLDDAYRMAKIYIERWDLEKNHSTANALKALDEWKSQATTSTATSFLAGRRKKFPIIDMEIHNSFDDQRPWIVSFSFSVAQQPSSHEVVACFEAVRLKDVGRAKELLEAGLDSRSRDPLGSTLLHQSSRQGLIELVSYLLDQKVEADLLDAHQETPLRQAVLHGQFDVGRMLLERGADINHGQGGRGTILHYAAEYTYGPISNDEQIRWLCANGADLNALDRSGSTPLHHSARKGHYKAAQELLWAGAKIEVRDKTGLTPLDYARKHQQNEIENLLEQ